MIGRFDSSTLVKLYGSNLSLNDNASVLSGDDDPRSVAKSAPRGSIYLMTGSTGGQAFLKQDNGSSTNWVEIGQGSSGGINYIDNFDAEVGVTGWSAYADAAGTGPVNGTGGSPTVTITRTTTTPLRGTGSFLLTKDASNRQGEGVSYDFTISNADKAKVLNISFDYEIASGTFAAGDSSDIRVWIYDVTNSALIQPAPYTIQGGSGSTQKFTGVFQTSSNSTSYRLILHCATTSASAYTFEFDNVVVGPQIQLLGSPITDFESYTATLSNSSNATVSAVRARNGGDLIISGQVSWTGAGGGGDFTVSIPSGLTIDTTRIPGTTGFSLGNGEWIDASVARYSVQVRYNSTTTFVFERSGDTGFLQGTGFANGDYLSFQVRIPITGWSSTVQMSSDTDTRVCAMRASGDPASAADANPIIFPTSDYDTHAAYNSTTGRYTVPVSGVYEVKSVIANGGTGRSVYLYVDAAQSVLMGSAVGSSNSALVAEAKLNAGQVIDIRPSGGSLDAQNGSVLFISRKSGPSAIAATEKVYLQYTGNGGTSLTASTTNIDFSTKVVDSHGTWSGTVFSAPRVGWYGIEGKWFSTANVSAGTYLYKNSSSLVEMFADYATATNHVFKGSVFLLAGETLSIRSDQNATLSNSATRHWISIYSQG